MPHIVEYPVALERLQALGLKCLYYNSGAFGFPADAQTISRGWIGPEDGSIREVARTMVRRVAEPFTERLAGALASAWATLLPGPVWAMPKSHWAFELEYGSREWMPQLLHDIGLDAAPLAALNNAAAVEFLPDDQAAFTVFNHRLLDNLTASDFMLVFPGRRTICTLHSHVQLWWTTTDASVAAGLDELVP